MSPHSRASSNSSDLPMVETAQRARAESLIAEEESLKHKESQSSTLSLHPAFYILSWIFFSNFTILFNKWLIDNAGFPIILTCWHLAFATAATQLLARTTPLLDSRKNLPINGRFFVRTIIPIGFLYSGSLVCSNVVYLYLSVSFIQMLKSASPVVVLFFSWLWGMADPTMTQLFNILLIVFGVGLASYGEVGFSWIGFMFQCGGIVFEAMRLVLIQIMLSSEGLKMDPLVSLYYYAPVCAIMNFIVALASEIPKFQIQHAWDAGLLMLFLNALVAFMLNVASVCLIGKTSGLVMTLTGIFKSILLVIVSVIIWQTQVSLLQGFGYSIALFGLCWYSLGKEQLQQCYQLVTSTSLGKSAMAPERRRWIILFGVLCFISIITAVGIWRGPSAVKKATDMFPSLFGSE
ncbi:unnamed protein product [Clonostachys solani]|uniref:Sugar phosphate transporter domain-containing protein n=1 Tax=Clonostachys solani TaxID=160281 RepID=A0A9N9ZPP7_9HYPO|nr:unnamed protein product [Clonostachys solani]